MAITPHCDTKKTYMQSSNGDCIKILLSGNGDENNPYILNPTLELSAGSIVCTSNGLDICISSESNNYLSKDQFGCLYARAPIFSNDECSANTCIDISVSGSGCEGDEFVISASPILDPKLSNLLTCGINGLLAEVAIVGINTNTASVDISGSGSSTSPFIVSSTVNIDPDPNNAITVTSNGLFVHDCCGGDLEITCSSIASLSIGCLQDVDITGIQDGQILVYDATTGTFLPQDNTPGLMEDHIQVLDTFNVYQFDADLL